MMDFLNNRHNTDGNYVFVAHISIFLYIFLSSHSSVSPHWAIFHLEYSNYFLGFSLFMIPLKKKIFFLKNCLFSGLSGFADAHAQWATAGGE